MRRPEDEKELSLFLSGIALIMMRGRISIYEVEILAYGILVDDHGDPFFVAVGRFDLKSEL